MWQNLVDISLTPTNLLVRALTVYFFIIVLLRIAGKREIGQMGTTEFVAILLISNAVQNSMNGGDNSLLGGMILALALVATSTFISILTFKYKLFRRLFEGTPTLLVHKGKIIYPNLKKERMNESELFRLLRKQGLHNVMEINSAILEADGFLSVTKNEPDKK